MRAVRDVAIEHGKECKLHAKWMVYDTVRLSLDFSNMIFV